MNLSLSEEIQNFGQKGMENDLKKLETLIFEVRGCQVILDRDLAALYGVETKALNQAVKRNIERFPEDFMFKLTKDECLRSQIVTLNTTQGKHMKYMPYAFTENGVAMLSSVLRSSTAIEVNIKIMRIFTSMRRVASVHPNLLSRMETLEFNQLELSRAQIEQKNQIEGVMALLEEKHPDIDDGIFYDGQIFDAYVFVADLVKSAKCRIVLIDNYVDESTLLILSKRSAGVSAEIRTGRMTRDLQLDVQKHNSQYAPVNVVSVKNIHDRFLIVDDTVYHIGASLKDLGKKLFAFSRMTIPAQMVL